MISKDKTRDQIGAFEADGLHQRKHARMYKLEHHIYMYNRRVW